VIWRNHSKFGVNGLKFGATFCYLAQRFEIWRNDWDFGANVLKFGANDLEFGASVLKFGATIWNGVAATFLDFLRKKAFSAFLPFGISKKSFDWKHGTFPFSRIQRPFR
jgi:hypothetical protein